MNKIYIVLSILMLALVGCNDSLLEDHDYGQATDGRTITFRSSLPNDNPGFRIGFAEEDGTLDLKVRFTGNEHIVVKGLQDNKYFDMEVAVKDVADEGKVCVFEATFPEGVDLNKPVSLVGFTGVRENTLGYYGSKKAYGFEAGDYAGVAIDKFMPPMIFRLSDFVPANQKTNIDVKMIHIGAYEVVHFTNKTDKNLVVNATLGDASRADAAKTWTLWNGYLYKGVVEAHPVYDLFNDGVMLFRNKHDADAPNFPTAKPGQTVTLLSWYIPNNEVKQLPNLTLRFIDPATDKMICSNTVIVRDDVQMQVGRAYHAWGSWDGTSLLLTNKDGELKDEATITITTELASGDTFKFTPTVYGAYQSGVYVDLNNNGTKDEGEELTSLDKENSVVLKSNKLTLRGNIAGLVASGQKITNVELSKACQLVNLDLKNNCMSKEALDKLFEELPNINGRFTSGKIISIENNQGANECKLRTATLKGWLFDIHRVREELKRVSLMFMKKPGVKAEVTFNVEAASSNQEPIWIDLNGDGYMEDYEQITKLGLNEKNINSFESLASSVEIYGNISKLDISGNKGIILIACSKNDDLKLLDVSDNNLLALSTNALTNLEYLSCQGNAFLPKYPLDLKYNINLKALDCSKTMTTDYLFLQQMNKLEYLNISDNKVKKIDLTHNPALKRLIAGNNELIDIKIPQNTALNYIDLTVNLIPATMMQNLLNQLPNLTNASKGAIWIAKNPQVGSLDLTQARNRNWDVDIKNLRGDNGGKRPDLNGEDW